MIPKINISRRAITNLRERQSRSTRSRTARKAAFNKFRAPKSMRVRVLAYFRRQNASFRRQLLSARGMATAKWLAMSHEQQRRVGRFAGRAARRAIAGMPHAVNAQTFVTNAWPLAKLAVALGGYGGNELIPVVDAAVEAFDAAFVAPAAGAQTEGAAAQV